MREVEGPGELLDAVAGGSITICPVTEDKELLVWRPGSFVDVGGIFSVKFCFLFTNSKAEKRIFSLFDKQFSGFFINCSSTTLSKLKLKEDLRSHDEVWLDVDENDEDLQHKNALGTFQVPKLKKAMRNKWHAECSKKVKLKFPSLKNQVK